MKKDENAKKIFEKKILEFLESSKTREFEKNAIPGGRDLENGKSTIWDTQDFQDAGGRKDLARSGRAESYRMQLKGENLSK